MSGQKGSKMREEKSRKAAVPSTQRVRNALASTELTKKRASSTRGARTSAGGYAVIQKVAGTGEIVEHVEVFARVLKDGTIQIASSGRRALPKGKVHLLVVSETPRRRPAEDRDDWLAALGNNPAFDFLKDPSEDIYTLQDGKPYHAEE